MTMKSMRGWLVAGVIMVFGVFLGAGLLAALKSHGLASSEVAGWIQAIGAIVAIAFAMHVAKVQSDELRAREARARLDAVNGLFVATAWSLDHIRDAIEHAETQGLHGMSTFRAETLRDMRNHVEGYARCPDQLACVSAMSLSQILREAEGAFRAYPSADSPDSQDYLLGRMVAQRDLAKGVEVDLAQRIASLKEECRKHNVSLT